MLGVATMTTKRLWAVNDRGLRVGEDHQRSKLTDADVELMRRMHENEKIGYGRLAVMFEVNKSTVRRICKYEIRCQTPDTWKETRQAQRDRVRAERRGEDRAEEDRRHAAKGRRRSD